MGAGTGCDKARGGYRGLVPLTFAYGSNLDPRQIAERCPGAVDEGPAALDEHELWFGGPSRLRGGGVLSVRPAPGRVQGRLWRIDEDGLASLDRFEGHPGFYRRELLPVQSARGACQAWVYRLRQDCFELAPRPAYLGQVRAVWTQLGLPLEPLLQASIRGRHAALFVYGTLRRGQANHGLLADSQFARAAATRAAFQLVELGRYPGMVAGSRSVLGEVWLVDASTLARLDELEGHPHLYERGLVQLHDGVPVEAYIYKGPLPSRLE